MVPQTFDEHVRARQERAWAAGFFDGEGWAAARRRGIRRYPVAMINQAGSSGVPEVLVRFRAAVGGIGSIRGPLVKPGRRDLYRWCASSRGDVRCVYECLRPWLGSVKRTQFRDALSIPAVHEMPVSSSAEEQRAWAAGLFDGEGSTMRMPHRSHVGYFIAEAAVTQSGDAGAPQVLSRFRAAVGGLGKIYGPFKQKRARKGVYRWRVGMQQDIEAVVHLLWPSLSDLKRAQAEEVLVVLRSQPPLPRGNPAWGSHKAHCVHDHEYATARVRPYVSRRGGTQRRDSKQCLACSREQAAAKRAATRANSSSSNYLLK